MSNILIKPLITEKMSLDTERNNSYGFVVADGANKIEIKKSLVGTLWNTSKRSFSLEYS